MTYGEIKIEGVTIYVVKENHTVYWTFERVDYDTAAKLWREKEAYLAADWNFWGDEVYQFNYVDDEHYKTIVDFLVNGGVGKKRAKRLARELIANHKYYENLED